LLDPCVITQIFWPEWKLLKTLFKFAFLTYRHDLAISGFQWATDTIQKKVEKSPDATENRLEITGTLIKATAVEPICLPPGKCCLIGSIPAEH